MIILNDVENSWLIKFFYLQKYPSNSYITYYIITSSPSVVHHLENTDTKYYINGA